MGQAKAATQPRTSGTAANALAIVGSQPARDQERERELKQLQVINDAVDAARLPGRRNFPGLPDDIYERFGDDIDRLSTGIINILAEHVPGVLAEGTGDYLPPSHIVMEGIDSAIWLALTVISDEVFGRHLVTSREPSSWARVEGDSSWHYVRAPGGCPDGA